ncbi:Cell wall-associated hydrolase, NlpC family [Bartonella sp. CDC_skunk]|uniref:C40 family peptidase n=1 Tax=unclassified Bartonella TaxID=2645622 RepID=UPI0009998347|nr:MULTISPECIES: NlpC/P60 family protein [unclassified Bartonella]AQX20787.1 Cell wall-associated hydrolase, NlpC family [Bartonella sp. CDC_skunk]AQX26041.1 Cell wall-associated hydrolase, NlpC family [Bartonella sp. Raccoon60]
MPYKNSPLHISQDILTNQQFETPCSVQGEKRRVNTAVAGLFKENSKKSEKQTECLFGEEILLLEQDETMSKVESLKDGYVGYIDTQILCTSTIKQTHIVSVPRTFQYSQADLKKAVERALSMGSKVTVVDVTETRGTMYSILENGTAIISSHLHPIQHTFKDYVTVAQTFIRTPYLWGGVSGFGLDCSGLVQLSMMMAGKAILRDTSMQQQTVGKPLTDTDTLERGDLIFWQGHVAIMIDYENIIHANGYSMDVMVEPLEKAVERIAKNHKYPVAKRRPL